MNKNKYKPMMFFAPDEGGGEGGGTGPEADGGIVRGTDVFTPSKISTGERPLPESKSSGPSGAPTEKAPPQEKPPAESGFDAGKFAKEFGTTLGTELKPLLEQREQKPPMSPEEARKLLKVWEPADDWFTRYDNLDSRKAAVMEMRDALMNQADTLAQARMHELIQGLKGEIGPQLESVRAYADQQRDERFVKTYPQLGKPELRPLVMAIADDLAKKGQKFDSEEKAFAALATGVESVIKVNNPEFKLGTAGSNPEDQNNGQNRNQIPTTSPGSGGGTGRTAGTSTASKARGISIFDK